MYRKLETLFPPNCMVIAPNAPFPQGIKKGDRYELGFSWYFYESRSEGYFIDMKVACDFLAQAVRKKGFGDLPKTIVGFSQGGYLAPFAALAIGNVDQVIGVACEFLDEDLDEVGAARLPFRVDGVCGVQDAVVSEEASRSSHQRLISKGSTGDFVSVDGSEHRIDGAVASAVAGLLRL